MRRCLKCGSMFDDYTNFCPNCGEKLVDDQPRCPSCGTPFAEGDKFCKNCGAKLEAEEAPKEVAPVEEPVQEEPKVEEEPKEEEIIAPIPVVEDQEPAKAEEEEKPQEEKKEDQPRKGIKIVNMIAAGLCLLAGLFFLIGMWGDIFYANGYGLGSSSFNIKYLTVDYPDQLNQLKGMYPRDTYYTYCVGMWVLQLILCFGGMVACAVLSIISIVKNILAMTKQGEPNVKLTTAAGASMLPIILFVLARNALSMTGGGYAVESTYGWGSKMIIAGLVFVMGGIIAKKITEAACKKENIAPAIIRSAVAIVMFILLFAAFGPLTEVKQTSGYTVVTASFNGYQFAESAIDAYSQSTDAVFNYTLFYDGFFSLVISIVGMALLFVAFAKNNNDSKVAPIVNSAIAGVMLIVSAALSLFASQEYIGTASGIEYNFADGPISGIVLLLVLVLPGLIVSNILTKKKAE